MLAKLFYTCMCFLCNSRFKSSLELMLCVIDISTLNKTYSIWFDFDILILFNRQWQSCLLVKWTFDRRRRSNIGLSLNLLLFDLKCNIGWRYRGQRQRQSRKCLRKSNLNEIRLGLCKITIMHCWNTTWFSFLISFYPKCGSIAETLHFT